MHWLNRTIIYLFLMLKLFSFVLFEKHYLVSFGVHFYPWSHLILAVTFFYQQNLYFFFIFLQQLLQKKPVHSQSNRFDIIKSNIFNSSLFFWNLYYFYCCQLLYVSVFCLHYSRYSPYNIWLSFLYWLCLTSVQNLFLLFFRQRKILPSLVTYSFPLLEYTLRHKVQF